MNYLFLTRGFEEIEAVATVDIVRRAGVPLRTVSLEDTLDVKGSHDIVVRADVLHRETDCSDAKMLILPGGTMRLLEFPKLSELLVAHNKKGGLIAAICAAPSLLGELGILEGKTATCYPGFEKYLKGANVVADRVVKSDNVITGRGAGCTMEFALEIVQTLCGQEKAQALAKALIL